MGRPSKFSKEVRERAVRMTLEHQGQYDSEWAATCSVAEKLCSGAETLRKWVRRSARVLRDGSTWIADSRSGHQRSYRLAGVEADVLWSCMDETPTVADLGDAVRLGRDPSWRIIRRLTRRGLLLHCDGMVLALPLRDPRSLRGGDARSIREGSTAAQIVGS